MTTFIKLVCGLSRLCGIAAAVMVLMAVAVVCQMVLVRYVFNEATYWQTEFVTYILIAATFIGSPYVLLTRGHVNVDLLPMYVGYRTRFALALLASTLSLAFCLIVTWYGYRLWLESWEKGWLSDTIWAVRMWIPYLAMPVGFAILSLQYVADIISLLTGRSPPFGLSHQDLIRGE
jgi:TRAP-type C4-dicarboxylate transport system permease small subunit